jgi:G3E family GTPase
MKIVEDKIHTINNFALTERSTYTAINLDFVLATDSYSSSSTKAQDPLSIFGFNASVQCFPCVDQKLPSIPSHQSLPSPPVESSSHPTSSITSLGFEFLNPFDFQTIRKVLDEILYNNGSSDMKIYRMKGLLKIHGQSNFFILQAVHNLFELDESTYVVDSGDSSSTSRVIIIGSNLNQIFLEERLKSALVVS